MGTLATIPGLAGGMATGAKNLGVPVLGSAGRNQYSPPTSTMTQPVSQQTGSLPGNPAAVTGQPPVPTVTGVPPVMTAPLTTSTPNVGGIFGAGKSGANLQKQLIDIYGKGVGGAIGTLLQNLGSNNSAFLDSFRQAMAGQQAEDLSTIGTSLGNAGISADSSTSAIEKADYLAKSNAQLGLQEQQLINQETSQAIGLVQGTQESAQKEVSSSWLDTLGQVAGIAGTFVGDATGLSSIGKGIGSAAQYVGGMFKTPQPANINPGTIPGLQSYDPGLGV